jgi:phosphosulfolactate synthase (CoM biosynthesis protein A)
MDPKQLDLKELADFLKLGGGTQHDRENVEYEIEWRQKMMLALIKGGDRPTYNPPWP